jgi:DMSO/TMAO reductase YedYZ molybdopterin-dependent catalytic subunit
MNDAQRFLDEHWAVTRRWFLAAGAGLGAAVGRVSGDDVPAALAPELAAAVDKIEPYFTPPEQFRDVSRGKPLPHRLSEAKKREVGLTRETWKMEVVADPDHPPKLGKQLTRKDGTALDFKGLMELARTHAVRFAKVMTCLNIGCPLGMGVWEGVPLRTVLWLTQPSADLRRVVYHGYHNDDPKQLFQSSLPVGRVLEDYFDLPPVILCYRLNGHWLDGERGGPVRVVVPETYGFKSIKWLQRVVLTNLGHASDTYLSGNNDVDSPLKTFAATLSVPGEVKRGQLFAVTGYAQVGVSGLSRVQVWVQLEGKQWPADDPYFTKAPWVDARILPPPRKWGGKLPGDVVPKDTLGFDPTTGRPRNWPMRLGKAHWAILLPGLAAGQYTLRCRTVDERGQGQPMPRPFRKSGHCSIEAVRFSVKG